MNLLILVILVNLIFFVNVLIVKNLFTDAGESDFSVDSGGSRNYGESDDSGYSAEFCDSAESGGSSDW